jgi:prepilin-type N-terminal cleavage/methylation domain-containing protein
MRAKRFGLVWLRRKKGFSIIEVITAVAILGIGIWAIVALFPTGQNIIRRSGLRQMATQLAHEAISDFLADPAKMPFAIVPFNPADPQIANRPVLLEPADLLTVRYTYNFVWGEPLDDGLPPGDPNKRVGLVQVGNQWRAILRFAPASPLPNWDTNGDGQPEIRVYREVKYQPTTRDRNGDGFVNGQDVAEFEFFFDPQSSPIDVYLNVGSGIRPNGLRVLRVSYELEQQVGPIAQIWREVYIVPEGRNQFQLNQPASRILQIVEEFPIPFTYLGNGVLVFSESMPAPPGVGIDQLGPLRADYLIEDLDGDGRFAEDPIDGQDNDGDGRIDEDPGGHWIVETGTTFDPDPTLKAQGVSSVFQTTFGGFNNPPVVLSLMPPPQWGNPIDTSSGLLNIDAQSGLLAFNLPVGTRLRVAYRAGDDPGTPVDESWFLQVIKPPDDFQLFTQADRQVLSTFPFERLRWFTVSGNALQFDHLLAGLNVQVRYRNAANELFTEVHPIAGDGSLSLAQVPSKIEEVRGASLLVRVSGGSMWRQSPPKTRADYVELITVVPPSQPVMP